MSVKITVNDNPKLIKVFRQIAKALGEPIRVQKCCKSQSLPIDEAPEMALAQGYFDALSASEQAQIRAEVYAECGLNAGSNHK